MTGLGDMDPDEFRAAAHAVVDLMADYLETVDARPVLPPIEPGGLRARFPDTAPEDPEALDAILADYGRLVEPNATHWQHPGFMAYFASTASGPGILGEMLTAALNQNPMLWRTSPIGSVSPAPSVRRTPRRSTGWPTPARRGRSAPRWTARRPQR